jgi:hypothetical protein
MHHDLTGMVAVVVAVARIMMVMDNPMVAKFRRRSREQSVARVVRWRLRMSFAGSTRADGGRERVLGVATNPLDVGRVDNRDGLGMFVCRMVLFGVDFLVLFEILGPFEGLFADLAGMGLQGCMDPKMASYMVSFGTGRPAVLPLAGQAQIIGAFPADVVVAEMVVQLFRITESQGTVDPETFVGLC